MKSEGDVQSLFQKFYKVVHTQFNTYIWVLDSDNKGEYKKF